jgi:hypothetical protein
MNSKLTEKELIQLMNFEIPLESEDDESSDDDIEDFAEQFLEEIDIGQNLDSINFDLLDVPLDININVSNSSVFDYKLSDAQNVSSVELTVRVQALDLELVESSSPVTRSKNDVSLSTMGNSLSLEGTSPTITTKTRKMITVTNIMSNVNWKKRGFKIDKSDVEFKDDMLLPQHILD